MTATASRSGRSERPPPADTLARDRANDSGSGNRIRLFLARAGGRLWRALRLGGRAALWLALALLLVAAAVHLLRMETWPFELAHHFMRHYAVLAMALIIAFAAQHRPAATLAAAMLAIFFGYQAWTGSALPCTGTDQARLHASPLVAPAEPPDARIRLVTYNIWKHNRDKNTIRSWLASHPADIIVLQEASPTIAKLIKEMSGIYPHRIYVLEGYWVANLIVLSDLPIIARKDIRVTKTAWPALDIRLQLADGRPLDMIVIHGRNPQTAAGLADRDRLFNYLAADIASRAEPVVLVGDLNATPYTPIFGRFAAAAGLAASCRTPASFPAALGPFGLPIDHVFASGAEIVDVQALTVTGSDHRPLQADLRVPRPVTPDADRAEP
jgi:endonuclease/exonuclease/phosphatase (EEP) superfamily protein YafD